MKNAKLTLIAITIFSIIGGVLAFKAKSNTFGSTVTCFAYTSSATDPGNLGLAGCFRPIVINNVAFDALGFQTMCSPVTFVTDNSVLCITSITVQAAEQ